MGVNYFCNCYLYCTLELNEHHQVEDVAVFSVQQERALVDMAVQRNDITIKEIQQQIIAHNGVFENIQSISLTTIGRTLKKHQVTLKQIYLVPFQRNEDRVKALRMEYVQVCV